MTFAEPFDATNIDPDRVCPLVREMNNDSPNPSTTTGASSSSSCFPAESRVTIEENGVPTTLESLTIGSKIIDVDGSFSDVIMFTHRDSSEKRHPFVELTADDGSVLTASAGHYVYTATGISTTGSLSVGSQLVKGDGRHVLVATKRIVFRRGLYNPQTISGSLVVDGFAVTCYTQAVQPHLAHGILSPLRVLYRATDRGCVVHRWLSRWFVHGAGRLHLVMSRTVYGTANEGF
jgi:Hint module